MRRQRILGDISRILLDYVGADEEEPLRRIAGKVVAGLGDWCAFSLVQPDGILRQVVAYHPDRRQMELALQVRSRVPERRWDAPPAETNCLVQRKPLVFEAITDDMLKAGYEDPEAYELVKAIGLTSAVVAPLFSGEEPIGIVLLASVGEGGRIYSDSDLDFATSLADRAALAVRNARLVRSLARERDELAAAKTEAERRAAELIAVLDADPSGIAIFGADRRVHFISDRLEQLFGSGLRDFVGKDAAQLLEQLHSRTEERERAALVARFRTLLDDRQTIATDEWQLVQPERRWIRRTTVPVLRGDGEFFGRLFVYSDVTQEKEIDRQRTEFLSVASHELRTPLTPLSMYLQTAERRAARGEPIERELLEKARRQVGRVTRLVEDLLDVSRIELGRLELARERVRLDELVADVVGDFRTSSAAHEIVLRRPRTGVEVEGDRARLEQVVVNLLQNALKYSPHGGQIAVEARQDGAEAVVSVADEGIGIPEADRPRLFQRFFRAANAGARNYGGLGIGLHISHEIVVRHGGRFEVQSGAGKGTRFSFRLPALEAVTQADRRRVLVIDDDPAVLEATTQFLEEEGYLVDQARDGSTALELVGASPPDLVLLDLMMPMMDGWTFYERLKATDSRAPVVVMSADRDVAPKAQRLGAAAWLRKPFDLDDLQRLVARFAPRSATQGTAV